MNAERIKDFAVKTIIPLGEEMATESKKFIEGKLDENTYREKMNEIAGTLERAKIVIETHLK